MCFRKREQNMQRPRNRRFPKTAQGQPSRCTCSSVSKGEGLKGEEGRKQVPVTLHPKDQGKELGLVGWKTSISLLPPPPGPGSWRMLLRPLCTVCPWPSVWVQPMEGTSRRSERRRARLECFCPDSLPFVLWSGNVCHSLLRTAAPLKQLPPMAPAPSRFF